MFLLIDFVAMGDSRPNGSGWKSSRCLGGEESEYFIERLALLLDLEMFEESIWLVYDHVLGLGKEDQQLANPKEGPAEIQKTWMFRLAEFYSHEHYGAYSMGPETVRHLDTVLGQLKENGIKATLATPPIHAIMAEFIRHTGNWENYETFLRVLADLGTKYEVPVWTFSPYHELCTAVELRFDYRDEAFFSGPHFYDPGHFNYQLGRTVLSVVRGIPAEDGKQYGDLGFRLTPENAESVLRTLRDQQTKFKREHPEFAQWIPPKPDWVHY